VSKEIIKRLIVLLETDKGLFEVQITEEKKKEIFKLIDEKQIIVLIKDNWKDGQRNT